MISISISQNKYFRNKWKYIKTYFGLHQIVAESTRITEHSKTLIDHVLISNPFSDSSLQQLYSGRELVIIFPSSFPFERRK